MKNKRSFMIFSMAVFVAIVAVLIFISTRRSVEMAPTFFQVEEVGDDFFYCISKNAPEYNMVTYDQGEAVVKPGAREGERYLNLPKPKGVKLKGGDVVLIEQYGADFTLLIVSKDFQKKADLLLEVDGDITLSAQEINLQGCDLAEGAVVHVDFIMSDDRASPVVRCH